jgi:potassium voltage-gated channel Eag-related subfamily H protein 5
MIFVSMMVLVTTILFGYVISSIQSIFAHMKKKSDDYKQKMALLNRYIRQYNLST